jgi:NAD(P)H-dependent nitrite reductase small subunit
VGSWIKVAEVSALSPGQGCAVVAADRRLALFNDSGKFYAIDDTCPHEGGSLSEGLLHEGRVICPLHSWVFELATGRCPRDSHEPVNTYPTRCSDAGVEVRIPIKAR